ncbi:MAG: hypothetical protein HY718_11735 [Planctomycetes bacterium]|nr:hypothetical protein [Planctomycetota bacterium]
MGSKHLENWLTAYDPIHRGWTRAGIANGLSMTNGFFFPRIEGGYNLYRAVGSVPGPSAELVGAAGAGVSSVQTFPWVVHAADTAYRYRLVPVGGGGVENWADETVTTLAIDIMGYWQGRVPNAPTDLRLVPLAGGRFAVRWTYLPQGQEAEPLEFALYRAYEGEIDYGLLRGVVPYRQGQVHYEYVTEPRPDGERVGWAVRTVSVERNEEQNRNDVFGFARGQPPPINPVVSITVV